MGNSYVGSNGGPYTAGKIYCGGCGEYHRRNSKGIVQLPANLFRCLFCGHLIRQRGRRWLKTHQDEPHRY